MGALALGRPSRCRGTAWGRILIYRALDGAEQFRYFLPLLQDDRRAQSLEHRVGRGRHRLADLGSVQAQDRATGPDCRGGFPAARGPANEIAGKEPSSSSSSPSAILGTYRSLTLSRRPVSRMGEYLFPADLHAGFPQPVGLNTILDHGNTSAWGIEQTGGDPHRAVVVERGVPLVPLVAWTTRR
jgi:hypothetical protein